MEDTQNIKIRKALLITLAIICLMGLVLFAIIKFTNIDFGSDDKVKVQYNKNKSFLKDQKIENLSFNDITCEFNGSDSNLSYTIINVSKEKIHLNEYEILIKDDKDEVLAKINPNYDTDLEPGAKFNTTNSVSVDLTKATSLSINLHPKKEEGTE